MHPMEMRTTRPARDDAANAKDPPANPQSALEFAGLLEKRLTVLADSLGMTDANLGDLGPSPVEGGGPAGPPRSSGVLPDLAECLARLDACIATARRIGGKVGNNG